MRSVMNLAAGAAGLLYPFWVERFADLPAVLDHTRLVLLQAFSQVFAPGFRCRAQHAASPGSLILQVHRTPR